MVDLYFNDFYSDGAYTDLWFRPFFNRNYTGMRFVIHLGTVNMTGYYHSSLFI